MRALSLETIGAGKVFGNFRALDDVSMRVRAGTVHALLGENGAGKSTLVKGIVGYGPLDEGSVLVGGKEQSIQSPRDSHSLGIGMVYQHFTVARWQRSRTSCSLWLMNRMLQPSCES